MIFQRSSAPTQIHNVRVIPEQVYGQIRLIQGILQRVNHDLGVLLYPKILGQSAKHLHDSLDHVITG
jgi:hypothetical protein